MGFNHGISANDVSNATVHGCICEASLYGLLVSDHGGQ